MDRKMQDVKMTSSWAFWNLEPPTETDEIITRIPIRTTLEEPEESSEGVCIHCLFNELRETNENLAAEIFSLKGEVEHLIRMLGGK